VRGHRHAPSALFPRERPGIYCTGGWVGPKAGLDRYGKSRPLPGFDPRTVQPVASCYTDYATRPAILQYNELKRKDPNLGRIGRAATDKLLAVMRNSLNKA
jgi:hypothetical protein